MIYIKTDEQGYINYQNNFPFHEKWGLNKTESELLQDGFLVDNFPDPTQQEGKTARAKYVNGEISYEYEDVVVPLDETQQKLQQLEADLGTALFESAIDKAKIADLETVQGEMLMEIAMIKMGGAL